MSKLILSLSVIVLFSFGWRVHEKEDISQKGKGAIKEHKTLKNSFSDISENARCLPDEIYAYLDDPDDSGTNIRMKPGGNIVLTLTMRDEEDFYFFTLTEAKNGWFKIKNPIGGMDNDIRIPGNEGWIHGSVIGVSTRNYGGERINLYDRPEGNRVLGVIDKESYGLKLKDMCGAWVKVKYKHLNAWVEKRWLCGNPLTTCP